MPFFYIPDIESGDINFGNGPRKITDHVFEVTDPSEVQISSNSYQEVNAVDASSSNPAASNPAAPEQSEKTPSMDEPQATTLFNATNNADSLTVTHNPATDDPVASQPPQKPLWQPGDEQEPAPEQSAPEQSAPEQSAPGEGEPESVVAQEPESKGIQAPNPDALKNGQVPPAIDSVTGKVIDPADHPVFYDADGKPLDHLQALKDKHGIVD